MPIRELQQSYHLFHNPLGQLALTLSLGAMLCGFSHFSGNYLRKSTSLLLAIAAPIFLGTIVTILFGLDQGWFAVSALHVFVLLFLFFPTLVVTTISGFIWLVSLSTGSNYEKLAAAIFVVAAALDFLLRMQKVRLFDL